MLRLKNVIPSVRTYTTNEHYNNARCLWEPVDFIDLFIYILSMLGNNACKIYVFDILQGWNLNKYTWTI